MTDPLAQHMKIAPSTHSNEKERYVCGFGYGAFCNHRVYFPRPYRPSTQTIGPDYGLKPNVAKLRE